MATRKFSAFTAGGTNQVPTDVLVGLDLSLAANAQNTKWTLNNLFAVVTRNITDGALRFGGFAAPAVSGAGEGSIYFDSTSNTFKISQNAGAYANIGNVSTTGFTSTRVPIANGANTLTDDAGLTFNTTTNILTVGETTGGGVGLLGSNGNSNVLASQAPAATLLTYWPNAAPTAGQFLYAATVGAQVQLGYQTAPSGTGTANQIAVWGASNALTGSSALTFASGLVSITGTTNPGIVISGSAATESGITVNQSVSGAAADAFHSFQTPSSTVVWRLTTAGFTPTGLIKANQLDMLGATGTVEMLFRLADASTRFVYGVNNGEAASINATSTLNLVLGADSGAAVPLTGRVRMYNSAGTTYSQISAGNAGSSLNFIWPVVNPTVGQVLSASAPSGSDVTLSWVSAAAVTSLTATQVGFGDGSNMLSGSADFTYTTATGVLDITKTGVNNSVRMTVTNASAGTAAQARFGAAADVSGSSLIAYSSTFTTSGLRTANSAVLDLDGTTSVFLGQSTGSFRWGLGTTEYAQMTTTVFTLYGPTTGSVTGLSVTSAAAGSGVTLTALSSGSNEPLILASKGTGGVLVPDGLAATPGIGFIGAATWGFYRDASYGIGVSIAGTQGVGFDNSSLYVRSTGGYFWGAGAPFSTSDLGITRIAAGQARLSNGSTGAGSLVIGTTTVGSIGTSGVGVLAIANGTAPTTAPADEFQIYSADFNGTGGDARLHLRTESGTGQAIGNNAIGSLAISGTDQSGTSYTVFGGQSTGTGLGGSILLQTSTAGGAGASVNALSTKLTITSDGRVFGSALHNNAGAVTGTTNQYIASGIYTPTVTAVTNCTATSSGVCPWIRVGNVVTVSGVVAIDPTVAATFTSVGISLPIASNFATNASECAGVAANANELGYSGPITADFTNDRAQLDFTVGADVSNQAWSFTFTYVVL